MVKRQLRDADAASAGRKRQRIVVETPTHEDVNNARQLRQLLAFDQDVKRARHGIQSFKVFLDSFSATPSENHDRFAILSEYLESTKPRIFTEATVYQTDLMEMWGYASGIHNESITAAVPAVLALLLQVISSSLELLPHATGIGQTLLQDRHLKLISRNLSASKSSGYIISPTMRLLREVASIDGGALAKKVFRARDHTFASFARNLEVRNSLEAGPEDPAKPSVRTNAIKLFLTSLKFLPSDSKKELLLQKEVMSHLTFLLKDDPAYLLVEMLEALRRHVLADDKVPREAKFKAFNTKTLDRLAGLYYYKHDDEVEGRLTVKDAVHRFLTYVCTTPGAGILYTGTGMYPKDLDDEATQDVKDTDDFAFERAAWVDRYTEEVPVANFVLDEFIQKMRPWSSLRHSELLVSVFEAAPELVASYFLANKSFSFEPKLSMTWIGYAAFLFNTVQLPIPRYFGNRSGYRRVPPPTMVLLDNIMPLPLKQKDLIRSLSHDAHLISFFAVRILVLALQKLDRALHMHREAAGTNKTIWDSAARKLVDEFCQRIPDMKEVTKCYKTIPEANVLQREATSRLLLLYYEVIPQMALMANFDVSPFLLNALRRLDEQKENEQEKALGLMELENLLAIAGYSPGMRWFAKSEALAASPFVALLRVYVTSSQGHALTKLKEVLQFVATQNSLSRRRLGWASCSARRKSCARRTSSRFGSFSTTAPTEWGPISLLLVTMAEQIPFAVKEASADVVELFAKVLSSLLGYAKAANEDPAIIDLLAQRFNKAFAGTTSQVKAKFKGALLEGDLATANGHSGTAVSRPTPTTTGQTAVKELDDAALEAALHVSFEPEEDNSALLKWASKTVDDLIDGDYIPALIRLLWSPHTSIRQEALTNILKLAAKLKESSYEEKDQLWLLLSELAESSRPLVGAGPVASPLVAFALHSLDILKNPLHCLYAKVNTYLTRAPLWAPDKVPLAHDILHGAPSEDDRYYAELTWLLQYLLDGLRAPGDVAVLHHRKWFEKILALAANPYLRTNLTTRVLRIVYRATCVDGGSTTLATRFGVVSWLAAQEAGAGGDEAALCRALRRRVWETCDQARVGAWSRGGIAEEQQVG
ncbi:conserved hypothetical protein [Verticillium alfalfae VaMs.102]|uniref:Ribosome biogenesis protein Urb1 n=1 Tax=Verticillium alfalfae (strain VaMs.102 / ATCC MYA-4576 / FGSC 10136) TaxID=526221 RepID=C9STN1_VERA1|nr:conserved hypothetical protein [Verticillium alfalfae VaMs.102]EEY22192.1 conserved hypothetical protein [Verticillium alfalfae VaMs.102]